MSSNRLFIFKRKRLAKYQSLLLIILFASIFIIPFSLAAQTKGVIINPPGTGGSGLSVTGNFTYYLNATGSTYNATYHNAARFGYTQSDASYARIMNNDSYLTTYNATYHIWSYNQTIPQGTYNITYHQLSLDTAVFNSTYNATYHLLSLDTAAFNSTYNSTYHSMLGNVSLWYNYSTVGNIWNYSAGYIFQNNLSAHVGIGTNNPELYVLSIIDNNDNNTFVRISSGYANGNATISFAEGAGTILRWQMYLNNKLSTLNFWNSNYDRDYLTLFQNGRVHVQVNSNFSATENVWSPNLCYANGSNCNLTFEASTYNATYHQLSLDTAVFNSTYNATYAAGIPYWYNYTGTGIYYYNMSDGSFNSTYSIWAYNQTIPQGTYNDTYHAVSLSTAVFNSTFNSTYEALVLSTHIFNSTYNSSYATWASIGNNISTWAVTWNATYHETSLAWDSNHSLYSKYWYNMTIPQGTYNITYHQLSLDTAVFNSTYNATYHIWSYNMSDGSYNLSYDNHLNNFTMHNTTYWYNMTIAQGTYNITYHQISLDTAVYNATYNSTYDALIPYVYNYSLIDQAYSDLQISLIDFSTKNVNSSNYWDGLDVPDPAWLSTYNSTYDAKVSAINNGITFFTIFQNQSPFYFFR